MTVGPEDGRLKDNLGASEAVFGFIAWLTSRKEVITLSRKHVPPVDLITEFVEANGLAECRDDYADHLKFPGEPEKGSSDFRPFPREKRLGRAYFLGEDQGSWDGGFYKIIAEIDPIVVKSIRVSSEQVTDCEDKACNLCGADWVRVFDAEPREITGGFIEGALMKPTHLCSKCDNWMYRSSM